MSDDTKTMMFQICSKLRWHPPPPWVSPVAAAPTCLKVISNKHLRFPKSQNGWFMVNRKSYQHCQNGRKWTVLNCFRNIQDVWGTFFPRPQKQKPNSHIDHTGCYWTSLCRRQLIFSMGCQSLKLEAFNLSEKSVTVSNDKCRQTTTSTLCNTNLLTCRAISHVQLMNDLLSVFEVRPISKTYTMLQASCTICVNFSNLHWTWSFAHGAKRCQAALGIHGVPAKEHGLLHHLPRSVTPYVLWPWRYHETRWQDSIFNDTTDTTQVEQFCSVTLIRTPCNQLKTEHTTISS